MIVCPTCQREFAPSRRRRVYCSRTCTGRARSKGGFYISSEGRAFVRNRQGQKLPFARCVLEGHLGRHLSSDEHVHHINGDCSDDRIENLRIVSASEHHSLHLPGIVRGIRQRAKLTADQVEFIKGSSERTSDLARRFNVTEGAIVYHRGALLKSMGRS